MPSNRTLRQVHFKFPRRKWLMRYRPGNISPTIEDLVYTLGAESH